jgi:hypothetical protein
MGSKNLPLAHQRKKRRMRRGSTPIQNPWNPRLKTLLS